MILGFHHMWRDKAEEQIDLLANMEDPEIYGLTVGIPEHDTTYFQIVAPEMHISANAERITIQIDNYEIQTTIELESGWYERIELFN